MRTILKRRLNRGGRGAEIKFELDGQLLPVKRSKVLGFAYRHRAESNLPPAICRIAAKRYNSLSIALGMQ